MAPPVEVRRKYVRHFGVHGFYFLCLHQYWHINNTKFLGSSVKCDRTLEMLVAKKPVEIESVLKGFQRSNLTWEQRAGSAFLFCTTAPRSSRTTLTTLPSFPSKYGSCVKDLKANDTTKVEDRLSLRKLVAREPVVFDIEGFVEQDEE